VICPNCGEENSSAFRFCGMCGTPLESQPPAPTPTVAGAQDPARVVETRRSEPRHTPVFTNTPPQAAKPQSPRTAATIAGPSLLGLGQDSDTKPDVETLRQKSFSGVDSFLEPEEQATSRRRFFVLLLLLVALGAAGWWTYSNYQGATRAVRPATSNPAPAKATPETPAAKPETASTPPTSPAANSSQPEATPASPQQEAAATQPKAAIPKQNPPAAAPRPVVQVNAARSKPEHVETPAAATPAPAVSGSGDADYRKGEAFLYGRGVAENCNEAVRYLKAASARQNAKARSAFGTMYATGHCVPRDLPTSYAWFALALRVDPNNQILEKDLTAIWNQMTPPERETATKSKQ
jgi:zinc-ribbon domain